MEFAYKSHQHSDDEYSDDKGKVANYAENYGAYGVYDSYVSSQGQSKFHPIKKHNVKPIQDVFPQEVIPQNLFSFLPKDDKRFSNLLISTLPK